MQINKWKYITSFVYAINYLLFSFYHPFSSLPGFILQLTKQFNYLHTQSSLNIIVQLNIINNDIVTLLKNPVAVIKNHSHNSNEDQHQIILYHIRVNIFLLSIKF